MGLKFGSSVYFGYWLLQQFVPLYKIAVIGR